jgi:hypothetical protein
MVSSFMKDIFPFNDCVRGTVVIDVCVLGRLYPGGLDDCY